MAFGIGQALRLVTIHRVLVRHRLDEIIFATHTLRPLRFFWYLFPWNWWLRPRPPRAVRLRRTLEDLGPIFVKFGQILSTRADLLPNDIALELACLQDRVTPFSGVVARERVEQILGATVEHLFQAFDETPLAAASVAQVHAARLHNGREVVVKVLRPDIRPIIRRDLKLLYTIANLAQRYWADAKRLHLHDVVAELEKTLWNELDLVREAANGSTLRRNFEGSEMLYVPAVEWDYTRSEVLVLERVRGIPVNDIAALTRHGVNLKLLAERGVEVFFTQVFHHNFFHADMHPGNIFATPEARYIAVDFGIMGSLSSLDQRYLAENFLAFFRRDYRRVAEVHIVSGWVASNTRIDEFEGAIRGVCEPIFQRPFGEISFGHLLLRLFQVARHFQMEVQPQLVLLQKTLLNIEGMGRLLYPQLDLWTTAKPFLERWVGERLGARAFLRGMIANAPLWGEQLPELPLLAIEFLRQARNSQIKVRATSENELVVLAREVRRNGDRTVLAVAGAALLIAAAILHALDNTSGNSMDGLLFLGFRLKPALLLDGLGMVMFLAAWAWRAK
ncbi:ubiquinone biosynthesis protein UbiB [Gammaproteobacteria bacterium]